MNKILDLLRQRGSRFIIECHENTLSPLCIATYSDAGLAAIEIDWCSMCMSCLPIIAAIIQVAPFTHHDAKLPQQSMLLSHKSESDRQFRSLTYGVPNDVRVTLSVY